MRVPLVAVTTARLKSGRVSGWERGAFAVSDAYVEAVQRAGGRPVLLVAPDDAPPAEVLEPFDAVLLTGGADVDPFLYGTEPHDALYGLNRDRDLLEIGLAKAAVAVGVPILAICRGIQVANVAFGGTLIQHLPDLGLTEHGNPANEAGYRKHDVRAVAGSRVAEICDSTEFTVSSSHHQAVDTVGEGFTITASAEDGITEALERKDSWFVAVQWHPEVVALDDPAQQSLFNALVREAQ